MPVQQIFLFPNHFLSGPGIYFDWRDRMQLRVGPAFVNFLRFTLKTDAVDFSRSRKGTYSHRHGIVFPFNVGNVLKQEGFALALFETAELPPHQRHQLGVLVDAFLHSDELFPFFQRFQMFSYIFVIAFFWHAHSFALSLKSSLAWASFLFEPQTDGLQTGYNSISLCSRYSRLNSFSFVCDIATATAERPYSLRKLIA